MAKIALIAIGTLAIMAARFDLFYSRPELTEAQALSFYFPLFAAGVVAIVVGVWRT